MAETRYARLAREKAEGGSNVVSCNFSLAALGPYPIAELWPPILEVLGTRSVCLDSTSTVADLKCKIEEDTGVPVWSQFLSDGRRVLENDQSVSPYHNSNRIDLRLRIRGGTKPSIRVTVSAGEFSPDFEDRDGSIVIASSSNNSQFNEGDIVKSITSRATSIDDLAPFNAAGLSLLSNQAFLNTVRVFGVVRKDRDPSTQRATLTTSCLV